MRLIPDSESLLDSASNSFDLLFGGGPADLTRQPSSIIDEGPQRIVHRYRNGRRGKQKHAPVLLVPPLAAPASCFDLRRGCSLAEHLIALGYPTYLVDYGPISFSDRALGLEHWVEDVLPQAIRAVSEDAGGVPVQPVGWCSRRDSCCCSPPRPSPASRSRRSRSSPARSTSRGYGWRRR